MSVKFIQKKVMGKQKKWTVGFCGIFLLVLCLGCTSVSGNVESAVSFSGPISVDNIVVGSYTYNINDTYIVCPDGSLILAPATAERKNHEAYYEKEAITPGGQAITQTTLKDEYHSASYDELYLWGIRCAAEKAGMTHIIAVKSFLTTTSTAAMGVTVARQDVTLTVFGESPAKSTE